MAKVNLIGFVKNVFKVQNDKNLERALLPNPLFVVGIFTVLYIIAVLFIIA